VVSDSGTPVAVGASPEAGIASAKTPAAAAMLTKMPRPYAGGRTIAIVEPGAAPLCPVNVAALSTPLVACAGDGPDSAVFSTGAYYRERLRSVTFWLSWRLGSSVADRPRS